MSMNKVEREARQGGSGGGTVFDASWARLFYCNNYNDFGAMNDASRNFFMDSNFETEIVDGSSDSY